MDLTDALVRGWRVFRADRALWLLGILAALFGVREGSSSGGGGGNSFNYTQPAPTTPGGDPSLPPWVESEQFRQFIENPLPLIATAVLAALAFSLVWWLIGTLMRGALLHRTSVAAQEQRPPLGESFAAARASYGRQLLLLLTINLPGLIVGLIAAMIGFAAISQIPALARDDASPAAIVPAIVGSLFCLIPLILLLALYSILISLLEPYALRSCVLEGTGVRASLSRSWRLLRANAGPTLFNWFVLGALATVITLGLSLPMLIGMVPMMQGMLGGDMALAGLSVAGMIVYWITVGTIGSGLVTGYNNTVWTVLYRDVAARQAEVAG